MDNDNNGKGIVLSVIGIMVIISAVTIISYWITIVLTAY